MLIFVLAVGAYLIGSIPVGYLVARAKGVDILHFGSGNIGATNVFRAFGKGLGLLVFILDVLKGAGPAVAAYYLTSGSQVYAFWIGMAAVVGHCLSPFLKFKGGKGIATGLGAVLGSCWQVALVAFVVFIVCLAITRYVSASSILAALTIVPAGIYFEVQKPVIWALGALAVFVIYRHRPNISRLLAGTEPRFSLSSATPPGGPRMESIQRQEQEPRSLGEALPADKKAEA